MQQSYVVRWGLKFADWLWQYGCAWWPYQEPLEQNGGEGSQESISNSWRKQKAKKVPMFSRHLDEKEETSWKLTKEALTRFLGWDVVMFTEWRKKPRNGEMQKLEAEKQSLEEAQTFGKSKDNYPLGQKQRNEDGWDDKGRARHSWERSYLMQFSRPCRK